MKVFSPTAAHPRPQRLWQAAELSHSHGMTLLEEVSVGLDGKVARLIAEWAKITQSDLRKMCGISSTMFSRSLKARFSVNQSERLVRIIRVLDRTMELFEGNLEEAKKWLNEPNRALRWKVPAELLASETGAYEVMKLITRLEQGVYS
jgi:putative toxin-antitoxin system antitoxin component (TIGR02293 family)